MEADCCKYLPLPLIGPKVFEKNSLSPDFDLDFGLCLRLKTEDPGCGVFLSLFLFGA